MDWLTGRTKEEPPDKKVFIVLGGHNNIASGNAPNEEAAAENCAL